MPHSVASATHSSVAASSIVDYHDDTAELSIRYLRERGLLWALITLFGSFFLAYINVGTPIPFLADALKGKNVDSTSIGAAYAMHPMGITVAQLFTHFLERRYGTVRMHSGGFLLAGSCTLLMAFAFEITTHPRYLAVFMIAVRFLQGLGEGITDNAIISMYQLNFDEVMGKVLGISEGAIGLGLAVGPLLGGSLYHWGGYKLPLVVVSVPFFIVSAVGPFLMRDFKVRQDEGGEGCSSDGSDDEEDELIPKSPTKVEKPSSNLLVGLVALGIFSVNFGYGCVTPLFPIYLNDEFGWNEVIVGGIFAVGGVVYFISGLYCGHLSDKNVKTPRPSIYPFLLGPLISGLSYIAAGPFPGLPFSKTLQKVFILSSVPFAALGQAFAIICGMGTLTVAARTHSLASSAFNASLNLGLALGPIGGTLLKDLVGFRWAMAANLFLEIAVLAVAAPFGVSAMGKLNDAREAAQLVNNDLAAAARKRKRSETVQEYVEP
eukprot:TRINITY_DN3042_c0_g1_i2.p1 TRINITY_DN3042_c0_g1~~TRINITY_DN3042_c0_g1_i2.p1  ORF type:complete len:512 (+),score=76.25 TRINITY_DN3042_c0_g1_i2:64-1536(+)